MATRTAHLFVGFGGSGLKTLFSLARLISGDGTLRDRMVREAAFLLVDTDQDDLVKFGGDPSGSDPGLIPALLKDGPIVEKLLLSARVPVMANYVAERFATLRRRDRKGFEEAIRHWWSDDDAEPFTAHQLRKSPLRGAGALPLVSQFLAWSRAEEIQSTITSIIQRLRVRVEGDFEVQSHFVAGLAGGTGRGCWATLSFAVRQALLREGLHGQPSAYLFDATIFPDNEKERESGERLKRRINALSGLSEIAMWQRNEQSGKSRLDFHLPSLQRPLDESHRIFDTRVLAARKNVAGRTPAASVHVFFGANVNGRLPEADDYYDMTGACLYAALSDDRLEASAINAVKQPFDSAGSNRVEVPIAEIGGTLRDAMQWIWLDRMVGASVGRDRIRAAERKFTEAVDIEPGEFVRIDAAHAPDQRPSERLTDRIWQEAGSLIGLDRLTNLLSKSKVKEAIAEANSITLGKADAASAVRDALEAPSNGRTPVRVLLDAIHEGLRDEQGGLNMTCAREVLADALSRLDAEINDLERADAPASGAARGGRRGSVDPFPDPANAIKGRRGRQIIGLMGRRFSDKEIAEIEAVTRRYALKKGFDLVRQALIAQFKRYRDQITAMIDRFEATISGLVDLKDPLDRGMHERVPALRRAAGGAADIDWSKAVFADPDHLESICRESLGSVERFDETRHVRTVLLPPMGVEDLREMCRTTLPSDDLRQALRDAIGWIAGPDALDLAADPPSTKRVRGLSARVSSRVRDCLSHTMIDASRLNEEFSLFATIESIRSAFQNAFDKHKSSRKGQRLQEVFETVFNSRIELTGRNNEPQIPTTIEIVDGLAIRLADRCDPFARPRMTPISVRKDYASLVVPEALEDGLRDRIKKDARLRAVGLKPENVTVSNRRASHDNPFVMLAFVGTGYELDHGDVDIDDQSMVLASIDYWKNDADLVAAMLRLEDPRGRSIFSGPKATQGLAYTNRLFVADPQWAALRWRPWYTESEQRQINEGATHRVEDALLYMLLGEVDTGDSVTEALLGRVRKAASGKAASIETPIATYSSGRMRIARQAVVATTIGGRETVRPGHAIEDAYLKSGRGIEAMHNFLAGNAAALDEVLGERAIFDHHFSEIGGRGAGRGEDALRLQEALVSRVDKEVRRATRPNAKQIWKALLERARHFRIGAE